MGSLEMRYFVLKPAGSGLHGEASREAVLAYAAAIEKEDVGFAQDLRMWVNRSREAIPDREPLEKLKGVHKIQGSKGNWDYDPYMTGLFNGLELALSIFEGRTPDFRSPQSEEFHTSEEQQLFPSPIIG